jgi:flagellar biosynthesis protein FlhG
MNQASKLEQMMKQDSKKPKNTRFIAITSGKGGVGKSTISANLGFLLSKMGLKIAILDADIGLANLDVIFNVEAKKNILDVLKNQATLEDVVTPVSQNLFLIPGESGDEIFKFNDREIVDAFLRDAEVLSGLDIVIIDTGAGISEHIQRFLNAADDVIVVTVPDPAAITDAYATIKVVSKEKDNAYMIFNQVKSVKEATTIFTKINNVAKANMKEGFKLELIGQISKDETVAKATKQRLLFAKEFSTHGSTTELKNIAKKIARKVEHNMLQDKDDSSISNFFKKLLGQF